jgi:hypothetical protein
MAVVYALLQPVVNQRFGWQWPALQSLLQQVDNPRDPRGGGESSPNPSSRPERPPAGGGVVSPGSNSPLPEPPSGDSSQGQPTEAADAAPSDWLPGLLKPLGRDEYLSPAGLRYTRGSEEGHRLKHVARHLEDQPQRPGRHGVFAGSLADFLQLIDQGFLRAKEGGQGTRQRIESGRTVFEIDFSQPIGFVGGQEGGRLGRPSARRLRLIVDQDRVITAFPY